MITWLASFPRSGSLLLRQILFYALRQRSYHLASDRNEIAGDYSCEIVGPMDDFVAQWADAPRRVLVKTHDHPRDDFRAIYVVRDGRAVISSFLKFERTFSPGVPRTMLELILGAHHYGGWSEHYRAWHSRPAPILTLRYEDLVDAQPSVLQQLASFIGYEGDIAEWVNPIDESRERHPDLVGEGRMTWVPPKEWTDVCDAVFWSLHGTLMRELGFARTGDGAATEAEYLRDLLPVVSRITTRMRELERACAEKEAVIRDLDAVCADREAALRAAVEDLNAKEAVINALRVESA